MKRIIVAIGGGENGRQLEDGTYTTYDTKSIDEEIIKLTNKERPNFLFLDHAMMPNIEIEESYYVTMKKIYGNKCNCDVLYSNELNNKNLVEEKIEKADIIYEGGGDTLSMIKLWKKTGFDKLLFDAWNNGNVLCGISAGAVCWFEYSNSDTESGEFTCDKCLGWFKYQLTPHANELGRIESTKKQLKRNNKIGVLLSNACALEIVDNEYKILKSKDDAFSKIVYWKNGKYINKDLIESDEFRKISEMIE